MVTLAQRVFENDHCTLCETARTLTGDHDDRVSDTGMCVVMVLEDGSLRLRRMTPLECMRLKGFPDFYLLAPTSKWRKCDKELASRFREAGFGRHIRERNGILETCLPVDSVMYKAAGNSWQVNVPRWILKRMEDYDVARF